MECTTKVDPGQGYEEGSLGAAYLGLKDQRAKRGIRYALAPLLMVMTLAKLGGEDEPKAIAEWVSLRSGMLKALPPRPTPFNIGIAGRAARTSPIDCCFCL